MDKKQEDEKIYFDDILYYYRLLTKKLINIYDKKLEKKFDTKLEEKINNFKFLLSKNNLYDNKKFTPTIKIIEHLNNHLSNYIDKIMNSDIDETPYLNYILEIIPIIYQNIYYCNIQIQSMQPAQQPAQFLRKSPIAELARYIYKEEQDLAFAQKLYKEDTKERPHNNIAAVVNPVNNSSNGKALVPPSPVGKKHNSFVLGTENALKAANFKKKAKPMDRVIEGKENSSSPSNPPNSPKLPPPPRNSPRKSPTSPTSPTLPSPSNPPKLPSGSRNLVLINAVADGDCFINAIFDYGLYTNNLNKIYDKLKYIENKILTEYITHINYNKYVQKIQNDFYSKNIKHYDENYYENIINKSLYLVIPIDHKYTNRINITKYYSHLHFSNRSPLYDGYRSNFIKYMKYIWAIYSLTINFKDFKYNLQHNYFIKTINEQELNIELPTELKNFIINKYYNDNKLKLINDDEEERIYDNIIFDYINEFLKNDNIFSSYTEISIFKKFFMEPITEEDYKKTDHITDPSFNGDKFFIYYKKLNELNNGDEYKKTYKTNEKEHDISVINENDNHFLLCLYEDEMIYHFDNNGEITSGLT